jgi:hypothetical protein
MRRFTHARLLCGLTLGLAACVELPEPPQLTDLSYLTESFEEPEGELPREGTEEVLEAVSEYLGVAYSLDGLTLLTTAMYDTSQALDDALPPSVKAQGKIDAELACPGAATPEPAGDDEDSEDAEDEEPENGTLTVTMGIFNSRIQRGVAGRARDCRFVSMRGQRRTVTLSADIQADFGRDIEIGEEPEGFLTVQLTDLELRTDDGLSVSGLQDAYNFRVVKDDAIEILIDSVELGVTDYGNLVVISYTDGSTGLREARGEWHCDEDGSCDFTRR